MEKNLVLNDQEQELVFGMLVYRVEEWWDSWGLEDLIKEDLIGDFVGICRLIHKMVAECNWELPDTGAFQDAWLWYEEEGSQKY